MKKENQRMAWIKTGSICGLLGGIMYFAAAFAPLPAIAVYVAAFSFGPLLAIGCIGIYYFLSYNDASPRLQIAAVSAIAGCVTLLMMLTVQQAIFAVLENVPGPTDAVIKPVIQKMDKGFNSIHFGLDIAWDILISTATILFSYSMIKQKGIWKIAGITGLVSGLLLLSFNIYYFPQPPASINSIDWGPFVAIWYLGIFTLLLVSVKKIKTSYSTNIE